ncbi:hypothetical protein AB0C51_11905, partial [Streptomyces pathocidini]|uniref:hypothetical protein n=1 Tax=Streptomyces pathocidini TaxID=1650571 RepID=UPI0033CAFB39
MERGQQATVVPARLFLFDRPGASSTPRYLVQGDRVEMLDEQDMDLFDDSLPALLQPQSGGERLCCRLSGRAG